jgi:hypothetical protein
MMDLLGEFGCVGEAIDSLRYHLLHTRNDAGDDAVPPLVCGLGHEWPFRLAGCCDLHVLIGRFGNLVRDSVGIFERRYGSA